MKLSLLYESKTFKKKYRGQLSRIEQEYGMPPESLYDYILTFDPTGSKYLPWLLANWETIPTADFNKEYLTHFEKLTQKGAGIERDIGSYTPSSLMDTVHNMRNYESKRKISSKKSLLVKGFKKVKATDNLVTYKALDPAMLAEFVKGRTPWCIANAKHAKTYMESNHGIYLVLDQRDSSPVLCFSGDYSEFYDMENRQLHPMHDPGELEELFTDPSAYEWEKEELEEYWASYLPQNDFYWQRGLGYGGWGRKRKFDFSKYDIYSNPDIALAWAQDNFLMVSDEEYHAEHEKGLSRGYDEIVGLLMSKKLEKIMNDPKHNKLLKLIASNPKSAIDFALIVKGPFLMGEKTILTHPFYTAIYSKFKHKSGKYPYNGINSRASFDEWPEARRVVTQDMDALTKWCIGKGRLPEYEKQIATTGTPNAILTYANMVALRDWHEFVQKEVADEAEATIFKSPSSFESRLYDYRRLPRSQECQFVKRHKNLVMTGQRI